MTALQLIERAFRLLAIKQSGESLNPDESSDALIALNLMLHSLQLDGFELEFDDLTLTTELPYDDDHMNAFAYLLAIDIAPEYGKSVRPEVASRAQTYLLNLRHAYANPPAYDAVEDGKTQAETYY